MSIEFVGPLLAIAVLPLTGAHLDIHTEPRIVPYVYDSENGIWPDATFGDKAGPNAELRKFGGLFKAVLTPRGMQDEQSGCFIARWITTPFPYRDLLVSWNVDCPTGAGFSVEVSVGLTTKDEWSPWMYLGDWGVVPALDHTTRFEGGRIETDHFHGERSFDRVRVRIRAFARDAIASPEVVVQRLRICSSDPKLLVDWSTKEGCTVPGPSSFKPPTWIRRLSVPFRSQRIEKLQTSDLSAPASLAMVLAFWGVEQPTALVAGRIDDPLHGGYDCGPRIAQAAYSYGVRGYVTRLPTWEYVEDMIAYGKPILCMITARKNELHGAPYDSTSGHLIVLTGFRADGDCLVNDPAADDAKHGQIVYSRAEMQKVWLDQGGTAYVLDPRKP